MLLLFKKLILGFICLLLPTPPQLRVWAMGKKGGVETDKEG
jgi:hypothetical protein